MKIFCHNGITPNIDILKKYGIKIQSTYERNPELGNNAYIIELPRNLKIVKGKDLPKIVSSALGDVIVDENENIICSLHLEPVNYQYASESITKEKMYDYHCYGLTKFYEKSYPSPSQLENMSKNDIDKLMDIIEEMRKITVQPKFETDTDDTLLIKSSKFNELINTKYQDLLFELSNGKINQNEFQQKISQLHKLETSLTEELDSTSEKLTGHSKFK